jgi:hypothetical protein
MCPPCERLIYRGANLVSVQQVRGELDITFPKARRQAAFDIWATALSKVMSTNLLLKSSFPSPTGNGLLLPATLADSNPLTGEAALI